MQPEHLSRFYNGPAGSGLKRTEPARKTVAVGTARVPVQGGSRSYPENVSDSSSVVVTRVFGGGKDREAYIPGRNDQGNAVSAAGFHIELGDDRARDDDRAMYRPVAREHAWRDEEERARGMATQEPEYREMSLARTATSTGSQSAASDTYDEDDADVDLETEGERQGREVIGGERGADVLQKAYESLAHSQAASLLDPVPATYQRAVTDRDRGTSKTLGGNQKYSMFLSSPTIPFLNNNTFVSGTHVSAQVQGNETDNISVPGRERLGNGSGVSRETSEHAVANDIQNYFTNLLHCASGAPMQKGQALGNDSGERRSLGLEQSSVRHFLSDPISGMLMDDATIFPCGHSYGNSGLQSVYETNCCFLCAQPIRPELGFPNYGVRAAVQAFRRERELPKQNHPTKPVKRRRERHEQEVGSGDLSPQDGGRVKGVQFPFVVSDRVLIKGNKRTPERFVGREAEITTQCLNGWYMVRTLDNGESVRLQYRSLEKVGCQQAQQVDNGPQTRDTGSSWL